MSGGMSWIASLTATWLNPQVRQSATVSATASASSGRDCGDGGTKFSSIPTHLRRLGRAPSPAAAGNASRHRERPAGPEAYSGSAEPARQERVERLAETRPVGA